jgi:hypothetical protein
MTSSVLLKTGVFFKKANIWSKILDSWASSLGDYEKALWCDEQEQGFYYNERANLGFFVLALHKSKIKAILQEFAAPRIFGQNHKTKFQGRCDLYSFISNDDCYFESKQFWPSITRNIHEISFFNNLDSCLKEAEYQLNTLEQAKRGCVKIAIVFITPYQSGPAWQKNKNAIIKLGEILKKHFQNESNIIIGKYIPIKSKVPDWKKYRYPGVYMLLKLIK